MYKLMYEAMNKSYGSRRGLLRHLKYSLLHLVGIRFGTVKVVPATVERLVFVCKGNICRSALADCIVRQGSQIGSASFGLEAGSGVIADPRFTEYLRYAEKMKLGIANPDKIELIKV